MTRYIVFSLALALFAVPGRAALFANVGFLSLTKSVQSEYALVSNNPDEKTALDAQKWFRRAARVRPSRSTYLGLALTAAALGTEAEAITAWGKADSPVSEFISRAEHYKETGEWREALVWYERATKIDPSEAFAWYSRGIAEEALGDDEEASQSYSKALEQAAGQPFEADIFFRRGNIRIRYEEWESAEADLEQAVRLVPNRAPPHLSLGITLQNLGRVDESIREFETTVALDSSQFRAYLRLAELFQQQGQMEKALAWTKRGQTVAPDEAWTWITDGQIHLELGKTQEALTALTHAVELEPELAAAHFWLGRAWAAVGDWNQAQRAFQKAIGLAPDRAWYYVVLGDAYFSQGKTKEAEAEYRAAQALDPDFEGIRERLEKLSENGY
jgi:tetratricopeptide (TPR) repeat protein